MALLLVLSKIDIAGSVLILGDIIINNIVAIKNWSAGLFQVGQVVMVGCVASATAPFQWYVAVAEGNPIDFK